MEKDIWEETNFYGVVDDVVDKYTYAEKQEIKDKLNAIFGTALSTTFLRNADFFTNFINYIPPEEYSKYIENTINYGFHDATRKPYDPNYVLVARRAVPSYKSKPENFWSTDPNEPLCGLKNEIQNEERLHSVIMVSTLGKLLNHGQVYTSRGRSDGEIAIDPNKNFSDFLFMYKPHSEFFELVDYLKNGGIKREELLEQLRATAAERAIAQGLPVKSEAYISLDSIVESTLDQTTSGINTEIQYLKQREKADTIEQDGWDVEDNW